MIEVLEPSPREERRRTSREYLGSLMNGGEATLQVKYSQSIRDSLCVQYTRYGGLLVADNTHCWYPITNVAVPL